MGGYIILAFKKFVRSMAPNLNIRRRNSGDFGGEIIIYTTARKAVSLQIELEPELA